MPNDKTRDDFARVLIQAGIPKEETSKLLGHKSDETIREQFRRMIELKKERELLLPLLEEERIAYEQFREALAKGESNAPVPQYSDEASFQEMTLGDEFSLLAQEIYESLKPQKMNSTEQSIERRFIGYFLSFDHALSAMLEECGNDQTLKTLETKHGETDFAPDCDPFYVFADYLGDELQVLLIQQSGKTVEEIRRIDQ